MWLVVVILFLCIQCMSSASPLRQSPMANPAVRQQRVETLRYIAEQQKARVLEYAQTYGFPVRWKVGHTIYEIMGIDEDRIRIYRTNNSNAAIAIGVTPVQQTAPYYLDGAGQVVGIWDGAAVLSSHQELTGRVTVMDTVGSADHPTHVAGTVIASGVVASAKGMAPAGTVDSYDWDSDESEVASRAMVTAGQSGTIQVSNHSYSFIHGWEHSYNPPRWFGAWQGEPTFESDMFGQYSSDTQNWDQISYEAPYYLKVKAAGNDRNDSALGTGATFQYYSFPSWKTASYDPAIHPKADGWDNGGYDTMSTVACAKNILTVGAVNDAVTLGQRDPSMATMSSFSGWGPTDDGRIKPDIVTNGVGQYSSLATSTSSYASWSGTSMAAPCAAGAASLLLEHYIESFSGQYMQASTLKGLILHTADDLGNSGPDYRFGFGLMNTQAAADLITEASTFTSLDILIEDALTTSQTTLTYQINYDGSGPIKATLCWTDPPGPSQSGLDNTTSVLLNDLDLRIIGPDDTTVYMPYVLNPSSPSTAATTGDNTLDNIEQIEIAAPPTTGTYTVEVSYKGTLTNNVQDFSLITTGNSLVASAPVASDVNETTLVDTPVTITLNATDDGLPTPPGALDYIITTLPGNGLLSDPASGNITSVPYTLVTNGNQVNYTPNAAYTGSDSFQFKASDGGTAPDGGDSNIAAVSINVISAPQFIYYADMDTNPGWSLEGNWAWGTPTGSGGGTGNPDPASGFTGSNVIGYNLSGDYAQMNSTEWATTPVIDCTDKTNVTLKFYRWLNVGSPIDGPPPRDHAYIEVSNDGSVWNTIWQNTTAVTDSSWQLLQYDISAFADDRPSVYIRWGIGETNQKDHYSGWNIDDVEVSGDEVVTQYTLTTSSTSGGVVTNPGEGSFQYNSGSIAAIEATADLNYHFVNWTGTAVDVGKVANPSSPSTTVTMDNNYTVQANFAIDTFTLEYAPGPGGTLTGDTLQLVAYGGDATAVTAIPNTGYHFVNWSDSSTENPRTDVNVTADINVIANFALNPVIISGFVTEPDPNYPVPDVFIGTDAEPNAFSDHNGFYQLIVDYGWSGTLTPSRAGYTFEPNSITYNNITGDPNDNFIATLDTFIISGYALDAEAFSPLPDVQVIPDNNGGPFTNRYYSGSDVTDANGFYEVLVDYNFSGDVIPSKVGYAFEPNGLTYSNVMNDIAEPNDYVGTLLTYIISGYVKNPCEVPIQDVLVQAGSGGSADITDPNGYYEVWVDYNWSGIVTPSKQHYTFEPNMIGYTSVLSDWIGQDYIAANIYDLNCDGSIDSGDLATLCNNWLVVGTDTPGDFYKDPSDIVNLLDFAVFSGVWGQ